MGSHTMAPAADPRSLLVLLQVLGLGGGACGLGLGWWAGSGVQGAEGSSEPSPALLATHQAPAALPRADGQSGGCPLQGLTQHTCPGMLKRWPHNLTGPKQGQ